MTITTFPKLNINNFPELVFIAGSYKELLFFISLSNGSPVDLTYQQVLWTLSPYTNPDYIALSRYGSGVDKFTKISLYKEDTKNLVGKYIQRIVINSLKDIYEYKLGQGLVTILPFAKEE